MFGNPTILHARAPCLRPRAHCSHSLRLPRQIKLLFPKLPTLPPLPADLGAVVQLNEALWCTRRSVIKIHARSGLDRYFCLQEALQEEAALEASQDLRRRDVETE